MRAHLVGEHSLFVHLFSDDILNVSEPDFPSKYKCSSITISSQLKHSKETLYVNLKLLGKLLLLARKHILFKWIESEPPTVNMW